MKKPRITPVKKEVICNTATVLESQKKSMKMIGIVDSNIVDSSHTECKISTSVFVHISFFKETYKCNIYIYIHSIH